MSFVNVCGTTVSIDFPTTLGSYSSTLRGGADAFKAVAEKAGVQIVSTDFHPQNAPDFTSILTRLQQRRPDAIATFQLGGDSLNFLRQAMQLGVRIPFTGRIELGGRNMPIIEAGGLEKSISAWQYSALADSPQNKAFAEKIKEKYKAEPYLQTWAGYDCIRVLAQAFFGEMNPRWAHLQEITWTERAGAVVLALAMLTLGLWSSPWIERIAPSIINIPGITL